MLPPPRHLRRHAGALTPARLRELTLGPDVAALLPAADAIRADLLAAGGPLLTVRARACGESAATTPGAITLTIEGDATGSDAEAYRLTIGKRGIQIVAGGAAGAWYAAMTLRQLLRLHGAALPAGVIEDAPDFPARGVMLDVSRDKVPTLDTLFDLVDLLAEWKINRLELYTEHTFAYRHHTVVWRAASPMTGEDILRLDRHCRARHIELVPNQNSFGHFERWLKHPAYAALAECPEGFEPPWGGWRAASTLNPLDPRSLALVTGLYDELLPHFSSRQFNVGLDETWELGRGRTKAVCDRRGVGRVYLDYLKAIHRAVRARGRVMHFWGDIVLRHPELIPALPRGIVALEWGYEADHPFDAHARQFAAARVPFHVCPGTSAWNSILGRTDNMLANQAAAAAAGRRHGASGYLNTDWGDGGHWQYLPVSYPGFAAGAARAWNAAGFRDADLPALLDRHAFHDRADVMGALLCALGNAHRLTGHTPCNAAMPDRLLRGDAPWHHTCGITPASLGQAAEAARALAARVTGAAMARPDAALIADEIRNGARLFAHGCDLGAARLRGARGGHAAARRARDLRAIIAEHRRLWLARNRPGGLADSAGRLERLAADYECGNM